MDANWDAIGAIGEIFGAFAVFISLLYLAVQIRNQNREAKLSATREFSREFSFLADSLTSNDLASIWVRAMSDGVDTLNPVEATQPLVVRSGENRQRLGEVLKRVAD